MSEPAVCEELAAITELKDPKALVCEACVELGGRWVHLRTCQTCGVTGCCDSSPGKHATAHFHTTEHPVMRSAEPGERWLWCFVHEQMVGY